MVDDRLIAGSEQLDDTSGKKIRPQELDLSLIHI